MPGSDINQARTHLIALAGDMRENGLDYYADHIFYVLRTHMKNHVGFSGVLHDVSPTKHVSDFIDELHPHRPIHHGSNAEP